MMALKPNRRKILIGLFSKYKHFRIVIKSVLEGRFGYALADDENEPKLAQIIIPPNMFFGGDPKLPFARELVESLSPTFCTSFYSSEWRDLFMKFHGEQLKRDQRYDFSSKSLDIDHICGLKERVPEGILVRRINLELARRINKELGTNHLSLSQPLFNSPEGFIERGIGFCALYRGKIVCGASSYIICSDGVEIQVDTHQDFRRRGIATAVAAALIEYCLERGLEPHWDAANATSKKFAEKLGYTLDEPHDQYWLVSRNN